MLRQITEKFLCGALRQTMEDDMWLTEIVNLTHTKECKSMVD